MPKFEGIVEDIVFRNDQNGWTVLTLQMEGGKSITAVGTMPFLSQGEQVVFDGEIIQHRDYGEQIKVSGYETSLPETKSGIERYLGSGFIKHIGPKTAKLIVKAFGSRTFEIMESEPERLAEIDGIGPKRAAMIAESFKSQNDARQTLMFLQSCGLSMRMATKVYKAFGDETESVVRKNPYRLAEEVDGIGFKTADAIALSMGFTPESEYRLRSGVEYALGEKVSAEGHVYLPVERLIGEVADTLNVDPDTAETAVRRCIVERDLIMDDIGEDRAVYLPYLYDAERFVAQKLAEIAATVPADSVPEPQAAEEIRRYEETNDVQLCAEQRDAVLAAAGESVCVVTGGPGTGKTTTIKCIIRLLKKCGRVALCAPTGRAAKRMSEATGREARTIHRLLEYNGEEQGFQRNADNPLDARAVIVDEVSMVDLFLMRSLLRALKPGTRLVLVGDIDQLPSVGAGNVLRDVIDSGVVRVVRLTQIFRQAQESMIVMNAHRINRGEAPVFNTPGTDFFLERQSTARAAVNSVVALTQTRLPKYKGFDSLRDIQVMTPMKQNEAGVFALNRTLQAALNPPSPEKPELRRGETVFRQGDKVMQIRNNYDLEWTRGGEEGEGAFNGDIGYIRQVDRRELTLTVESDDGRLAEYDESILDDLEHAYCMTVHKSQGSEFEAVVLPLLSGPEVLMTRNLLYTAVTRARQLVVVVGREDCVRRMVGNNRITRRYSGLQQRLKDAAALLEGREKKG